MFLHEAVAEALYLRVTPVKANEYEAYYKSLLQYDRDTGNTGLEQQFQVRVYTIKILKFGTPQTIAIIVLKIEKFDVTLH